MSDSATQARLNREFGARLDELASQIERIRVLLGHMERAQREHADQRRRECGITASDMDAVR